MSDITKIREWVESDEPEPDGGYDWPHPPICVESAVTGDLRVRILEKAGREGDQLRVRLVESEVEGGWSEYTSETDYNIVVWLDEDEQEPVQVWSREGYDWTAKDAMAAFIEWVTK